MRKPDFDNEWTVAVEIVFRKEFADFVSRIVSSIAEIGKTGATESKDIEVVAPTISFLAGGVDLGQVCRLLAYVYWEDDEHRFNAETYEKRVERFLNMPKKELETYWEGVKDFFVGELISLGRDFQTFSGSLVVSGGT